MTKTRGNIVDDIHEKLDKYSKGEVADIVKSVFDIDDIMTLAKKSRVRVRP